MEVPLVSVDSWFLEQVKREQGRLRSHIRALGVRSEEVDDLAQEALMIALKKLNEFDRRNDFGVWVRQIARKLVANERRKLARRSKILSRLVTDYLLSLHPGSIGGWEESGREDELELEALRECLSALPEHSRELVRQRYFEDLSPAAIGNRLGRTSNQVRQALLRLRRALLDCIERRTGTELA
jgi:RNA polymerase sigma-70 factor (ECF subfamily)